MERTVITIGSLETCDVVIADESIQPLHAELEVQADGLILPLKGVKHIIRSSKIDSEKAPFALNDELALGSITIPINDLLDTIRKRAPNAKLADPAVSLQPPKGKRRLGRYLVPAAVLLALGTGLMIDRERQLSEMSYLEDSVDYLERRISDPTNDSSSLSAIRAALESHAANALTMSKRWLGKRPYALAEQAYAIKKRTEAASH